MTTFTNTTDQVQSIYVGYFGRAGDPAGASYWVGLRNAGTITLAQMAASFAVQTEATTKYPYLAAPNISDPGVFIEQVYQNLFNHAADAAGKAYWTAQLTASQGNPNAIGNFILNVISGATGTDDTFIRNKTDVAKDFTAKISNGNIAWTAGTQQQSITEVTATTTDASVITQKAATDAYIASGPVGTTLTLTTGVDTFVGGNGNDLFLAADVGAAATWTPGDSMTGGAGTDTFQVTTAAAFAAAPAGATISGVERVILTSGATVTINTVTSTAGFSGMTSLATNSVGGANVTAPGTSTLSVTDSALAAGNIVADGGTGVTVAATGGTTGQITVGGVTAVKGAVVVTDTQNIAAGTTGGAIAVTGGTTVAVTSTTSGNATNTTATLGGITVTGSSTTPMTSVNVVQSAAKTAAAVVAATANVTNAVAAVVGVTNSAVTIADANAGSTTVAGTIASVTLQNYAASTISSSGLTALTLSATGNAAGTLGLTYGLTTGNPTSLALNLGGGSLGVITDNGNKVATLNTVMTANTTLAGFTDTALRTVALSGTGVLTLTAVNTAITSITQTGATGLTAALNGAAGLTTMDFSASSGKNTVTLNANNQTYTGGSGIDIVTITADALTKISGGTGSNTLVLNATAATFTAGNTVANATGFTTLGTHTASQGTYDLSVLTGFTAINVLADVAAATIFNKVTHGTTLALNAATTAAITYNLSDTNGANDTVSLTLNGSGSTVTGTVGYTVLALTLQDLNAVGIGTVNIATNTTVGGGAFTLTTLTDSALSALAITGTGSLTITNAATTATSLTISDNNTSTGTSAITTLTSTGNVLGAINYSGTHAFAITTLVDNVANATITNANTGTAGALTIGTWTDANLLTLTLNGTVGITAGTFANAALTSISGATDNASITIVAAGAGAKTITLGNGADTITTGAGADTITLGTGADRIFAKAGADLVTVGAHTGGTDTFALATAAGAAGAETGTYTQPGTNTISTTTFDKYTGFVALDTIQIGTGGNFTPGTYTGPTGALAANVLLNTVASFTDVSLAVAVDNAVELVRGNYTAGTNTFVGSATGTSTMVIFDSDSDAATTAFEAIVLVGYANTVGTFATGAAGVITL